MPNMFFSRHNLRSSGTAEDGISDESCLGHQTFSCPVKTTNALKINYTRLILVACRRFLTLRIEIQTRTTSSMDLSVSPTYMKNRFVNNIQKYAQIELKGIKFITGRQ